KKRIPCFLAIAFGSSGIGRAGGFEAPGVGARALAMGGAFVGLADDWTATYWNPAGLAQLGKAGVGLEVNTLNTTEVDGNSVANPSLPFTRANVEQGDVFFNAGTEPSRWNTTSSHMLIGIPATGAYYRWGDWVGAVSLH